MAINFDSASSHIRHALGGDVSNSIDVYSIINDAGDYMASMHPWRWLEDTYLMDSTSTEHWINLPTGFVELIAYAPRGIDSRRSALSGTAAAGYFYAVSQQELNDKREATTTALGSYGTTEYALVEDGAFYFAIQYQYSNTAVPVARAEIFPTPINGSGAASEHHSDDCAFTIAYRMAWPQITTPSTVFIIPQWMEPLYLQCLRAVARGYEEEDGGTVSARLNEIANGPLFAVAVQRDSLFESTTLRVTRRDHPALLAGPVKDRQPQEDQETSRQR